MQERDEILDWVRGGCALLVLAAHTRGFLFPDFEGLVEPGMAVAAFYFLTGLHHEAVMVFFVLSGYFVGGAVLKSTATRTFAWKPYAVARLTRLWVVLLPALGLTLLCDSIGTYFAAEAYAGGFHDIWLSGPSPTGTADHSAAVLLGNALFLQNIAVPVYGTNGPLWSLAYEFWYYVLFPLIVVAGLKVKEQKRGVALLYCLLLAALLVWLPTALLAKGLIWLMGVGVAMLRARFGRINPAGTLHGIMVVGGALLFLGTLAATKFRPGSDMDYLVGGIFALWMLVLPSRQAALRFLEPAGKFLASISYTLYVTHFPLLFFWSAVGLKGHQFESVRSGAVMYTACLLAAVLLATLFWWAFESRTDMVRRAVSSRQ